MTPEPLKIIPAPTKRPRLKILKMPKGFAQKHFADRLNEFSPQNKVLMAGYFETIARLLREKNVITQEDIENASP